MAATTTETSLATVRRFMNAILEGKLDEARSLLHDDFVISEVSSDGDCLGRLLTCSPPPTKLHTPLAVS